MVFVQGVDKMQQHKAHANKYKQTQTHTRTQAITKY